MGVLANHVPSIEQLKPGLVEIVEESGSSKQFFRMWHEAPAPAPALALAPQSLPNRASNEQPCRQSWSSQAYEVVSSQCPVDSPSSSPTLP